MEQEHNAQERCIYCGADSPQTMDHVPPKCLFPNPRPQLITVPACETCNNSASKDDEYFRVLVVAEGYEHPVGRQLWDEGVIGGTLHRSYPLRSSLIQKMRRIEMRTPAGLYLKDMMGFPVEEERINRVVVRIVRGLHWQHYQRITPPDAVFEVSFNQDLSGILDILQRATLSSIGGSVFRYRHALIQDDSGSSIWGMQFYQRTQFVVLVLSQQTFQRYERERAEANEPGCR